MTLQDLAISNPAILIGITLVIGFILGWLITGLPKGSRIKRAEAQAAEIQSKLNQTNQTITASQARERELQTGLDVANASLAETNEQVTGLQAAASAAQTKLDEASAQVESLQHVVATRDDELSALRLQQSAMRDMTEQSRGAYDTQVQDLQAELARMSDENAVLKSNLEGTAKDLASARMELETVLRTLTSKDTALTEAYARAVRLERQTSDEQGEVLSLRAEVVALKRNVATLTAANRELDARLQRARGEVAGELAALTATMLRVKDDELAEANATIYALQVQMAETSGREVPN